MIHGVTLNYHTGHITVSGGSASPKTVLLSENLIFSHCNDLNCFGISKRYHFSHCEAACNLGWISSRYYHL